MRDEDSFQLELGSIVARLGLKIFYLRTRVREISQQELADTLGVRQATLSNIERGLALPTVPLLVELSRFFDVTPTFLLDDARGVQPRATERWSARNGLVTSGMWIEAETKNAVRLSDGKLLCPVSAGEAFYDDEAKQRREESDADNLLKSLFRTRKRAEQNLAKALRAELEKHPRARRKA